MSDFSAQGIVAVKRIRNNDSLSVDIDIDKPLFQGLDENTGNPFPNWETDASSRPTLTPVAKSAKGNVVSLGKHRWSYNDSALTFNGNTTTDGFQLTADGKFGMNSSGQLRIFKNLASSDNQSSDSLVYTGYASVGSFGQDINAYANVLIQKMGSSAYFGTVTATRKILTEASGEDTTKLSTSLWLSTSQLKSSDYSVKWFKVNSQGAETQIETGVELTVNRSMVDGATLFIAQFYHKDSVNYCFRAGIRIQDSADLYVVNGKVSNMIGDNGAVATITGSVFNTRTNSVVSLPTGDRTDGKKKTQWHATAYRDDNTKIKSVDSNVITISTAESDYNNTEHDAYVAFTVDWVD